MALAPAEFTARYRNLAAKRGRVVGDLSDDLIAKLQTGQERALENYVRAQEASEDGTGPKTGNPERLQRLINEARYLTGADKLLAA